jgi:hypothetical protein
MHKFKEGETIALSEDHPLRDLKAGDTGVVVVLYMTEPPAYDVTFCGPDRQEFDGLMYEEELTSVVDPRVSTCSGTAH